MKPKSADEPTCADCGAEPVSMNGRILRIVYRVWRSPGGVAVEAEEDGEPFDGFYAEVVGTHDSAPLFRSLLLIS